MSAFLGDIPIGEMPLGNEPIGMAFLGDVLVFRKIDPSLYLRIEPEIVWVYTDIPATNDVISNTTWNIH